MGSRIQWREKTKARVKYTASERGEGDGDGTIISPDAVYNNAFMFSWNTCVYNVGVSIDVANCGKHQIISNRLAGRTTENAIAFWNPPGILL